MNISAIAFTELGHQNAARLQPLVAGALTLAKGYGVDKVDARAWVAHAFKTSGVVLFVGATGIAVRLIAPHLSDKASDPAVIVMDEQARFVVSLLSGHMGGANDWAERIARHLNATPVITTATDGQGLFAFDAWAARRGYAIDDVTKAKRVSAALLRGETIFLHCDFPIQGALPKGVRLVDDPGACDVYIGWRHAGSDRLAIIPPALTLGVGCRRGISPDVLEQAFRHLCTGARVHPSAVFAVHSIDIKKDEAGLLSFCANHGWPFTTFDEEALGAVAGTVSSSAFVKSVAHVDNVCERAALARGGTLLAPKTIFEGTTMALGLSPLTLCLEE